MRTIRRPRSGAGHAFVLELRRAGGEVLAVEPVRRSDLADLRAEALWVGAARRGRPELTLEHGVRGPFPVESSGVDTPRPAAAACRGLAFHVGAARDWVEVAFPRECLLGVARRAALRLVAAGALHAGDEFLYVLRAEPSQAGAAVPAAVSAAEPLAQPGPVFTRTALAPLLAGARAVDAEHARPGDHAVVFSETALERARAIAARGFESAPPVETGGVLLGRLAACPGSREAFVLVEETLEATDAVAARFSLEFTGATWRRIERVLRLRRSAPDAAGQLLVGQTHQHPFLPDAGVAPCADCASRAVCTRSSAVPSDEDRSWCRAVFHEAPWQLSLMFGLDARGAARVELYGQRGGALERRGYHVVPPRDIAP